MNKLILFVPLFLLCGCVNRYANLQHKFEYAVIETPYQEIEDKAASALKPYFTITNRAEAKVNNVTFKTLIVEIDGSRGLLGCQSRIMLRKFDSVDRDDGRLLFIVEKAGFFWSGQERAMVKGMRTLDKEITAFSSKYAVAQ